MTKRDPYAQHLAILVGEEVRLCESLMTWARWFEAASRTKGENGASLRHVGDTRVNETRVSTVFLGIKHGWGSEVHWFETMVFGGPLNELTHRYETYAQARAGHEFVCALVKGEERRTRDEVKAELARIARGIKQGAK